MCWIGDLSSVAKIAEEDIKVYKIASIIDHHLYSAIREYKYQLGIEEKANLCISRSYNLTITCGLHSYSEDCKIYDTRTEVSVVAKNCNSLAAEYSKSTTYMYCKLECVIPKGAVYYCNRYGEMVSDRLLPIKVTQIYI